MDNEVFDKVDQFFADYRTVVYEKGEIITQGGTQPDGVIYLIDGHVVQYDILPNGTEAIVNSYQPPAFLPMSWAINHSLNRFFFEAHTKVIAKQAPPEDVVAFIKNNPDIMFDLLSRLYRGTDGLLGRLTNLMSGSAQSRVQFELLNAALRFGDIAPDGSVTIPLTETDLARRSGLARETVSRALKQLKTTNAIAVKPGGGSIKVDNLEYLKELLDTRQ